ncbi:MAG: winged helix-turn-helix transcriptional regulator [Thermoplasmatota archaeon]
MRWLWSLALWSLLTTTAIAVTGLATDSGPDGGEDTFGTASSLPGDRAVYRSALVVVEGDEGQWFDLNARYAFERLDDRLLPDADGDLVPVESFVHEWVAEPFEFLLTEFLFFDFPTCLTDLTGVPMEVWFDPDATQDDYDQYKDGRDWESMNWQDWEDFEQQMEACGESIEAWADDLEDDIDMWAGFFEAYEDDTHIVRASDWHVSHVAAGHVVASTWRGTPDLPLVPDLEGAWTVAEPSEAPCGMHHSLQGTPQDVWGPIIVHGACPPTMDFGFARTEPLEGPVRLRVAGTDTVDGRATTVYAHEDAPDHLRLWFADDEAYPLRILSEIDVVPPEWLPYANNGHPPRFFILQEMIESEAGAAQPSPAVAVLPPVIGARTPWGPSDLGTNHPWPLSDAFMAAVRMPGSELGDWLINRPHAAATSATWADGWHLTLVAGEEGLRVHLDGNVTATPFNTTTLPDATQQPKLMASVASLADRHEAMGGNMTAWRFQVMCPVDCARPEARIAVGQHPAFGDAIGDLSVFDGQGRPVARVQSPDPYPDPRFADDAWQPDESAHWGWGVASAGGVWTWPEPKTAAGVAAATGLVSLLYLLWPLFKGAGALPLFSRIRSEDLLEHPVRSHVYEAVTARPGMHFQEIVRTIEKGRGTTEHHIRKLVAAGLLVEKADKGFTCYFPKGAVDRRLMDAAPVLKTPGARLVLQAVHGQPGSVAAQLSGALNMPTSTLNYHLKKLTAAGLVDATREGRSMSLTVTALGEQALGTFQT